MMRKLFAIITVLALVVAVAPEAKAQGELELSGDVTVVTGWQRPMAGKLGANVYTVGGILNDGLAAQGAEGVDTFGFYIDEVELDLAKNFGENIAVRADVDVAPARRGSSGIADDIDLEQGYVTANIPVGNGAELLVGRFNSGIGLDPVDRNELTTVSFSTLHRTLIPHNLTGAKFTYNTSEAGGFDFYVVNDLNGGAVATSMLPSYGLDIFYIWGEEGMESDITFSGAGGSEQATKYHFSFLGDLAVNLAMTEALTFGIEGLYRQDNAAAGAADNAQYMAGTLAATYNFSDIWDGTVRYGFTWDLDGDGAGAGGGSAVTGANPVGCNIGVVGLGADGTQHDLALALGYQITDGAKLVMEARMEMERPAAGGTGYTPGVAGGFYYAF